MPTEKPSLEAELGAAYDAAEADGDVAAPGPSAAVEPAAPAASEVAAPVVEPLGPAASGPGRDPQGKFTGKEQTVVAPPSAVAPVPVAAIAAPADWKPAAREKWASLPREVQEEASRVHKEVKKILRDSTEHRKAAEAFQQVVAPYRALLQGEPIQVVGNLLQTAAALQTGTPAQRAAVVAQVITGYGVDVEHLAAALEGKAPTQTQRQPAAFRDPRVDQLLGHLQQNHQQRSAAVRAQAAEELGAFAATAEFFEDVRDDMADVMGAARKQGRKLTVQQAYERACMLNEDVRPLYEQRKSAQTVANASPASTRAPARVSSSSLRNESPPPPTGKPKSLQAELEDEWDRLSKGP